MLGKTAPDLGQRAANREDRRNGRCRCLWPRSERRKCVAVKSAFFFVLVRSFPFLLCVHRARGVPSPCVPVCVRVCVPVRVRFFGEEGKRKSGQKSRRSKEAKNISEKIKNRKKAICDGNNVTNKVKFILGNRQKGCPDCSTEDANHRNATLSPHEWITGSRSWRRRSDNTDRADRKIT